MAKKQAAVLLDGKSLSISELVSVARDNSSVGISVDSAELVNASRKTLESRLRQGNTIYGVNTGFGELQNSRIAPGEAGRLQENLVRSTSAGVGAPLSRDETRAMMLLRLNTLVKGYSGVRMDVVTLLCEMLNRHVHPVIPSRGSVGASGDLAPLAHMALVLMGEGNAELEGVIMNGSDALSKAGLKPVSLREKEGLALINGTQFMTALGALAVHDIGLLLQQSLIVFSMSLESLGGRISPFDERVAALRAHRGSMEVAASIRRICSGSSRLDRGNSPQDPYTLRCAPQVIGPLEDMLRYCENIIVTEMNSTTDNPIVLPDDGEVISAGNFHGQPVAVALDALAIPLQALASFSERRTARLTDHKLSGLSPFLSRRPGLESGYMVAQYTAAALVSEGKVLSHPSSSDSIPTSANQEDYVSMGAYSALKLRQMVENSFRVIAIEAVCAAQALDLTGGPSAPGVAKAHSTIRETVPTLDKDREISGEIEDCCMLLKRGALL